MFTRGMFFFTDAKLCLLRAERGQAGTRAIDERAKSMFSGSDYTKRSTLYQTVQTIPYYTISGTNYTTWGGARQIAQKLNAAQRVLIFSHDTEKIRKP